MSDHPDIEKLPLTVHGIPVRETVREIFRNPDNGTPDNISKAGCLALAKRGAIVWNPWREVFPTIPIASAAWPQRFRNHADFSSQNFEGLLRDLLIFNFGDGAIFDQSKWRAGTRFEGAKWGDYSSFFGAVWGDRCSFINTKWGALCRFDCAIWGEETKFESAQWGRACIFNGAHWGKYAYFTNATLGQVVHFKNCTFEHCVIFDFSRFDAGTTFTGSTFEGLVRFSSNGDANSFSSVDFGGCEFKGEVDFGERKFKGKTNFGLTHPDNKKSSVLRDEHGLIIYQENNIFPCIEETNFGNQPAIFHKPPNFHGCELHQDTSFEGAIFPKPSGNEESIRAYRTLKLAFSKQQAVREEQLFYMLEMKEEAIQHWKKILFSLLERHVLVACRESVAFIFHLLYRSMADYGFSMLRPLILLVLSVVLFSSAYGSSQGSMTCIAWIDACSFQPDWLKISILQSLPLSGLEKLESSQSFSLYFSIALVAHKAVSLLAIFLIGLALRNLFKLK